MLEILSKEDRVIQDTTVRLEELNKLKNTIDIQFLEDYKRLFTCYKSLNKRFIKIIKINDSLSKQILDDNDFLKDSVDYTIKNARKKLLSNIKHNREEKETIAKKNSEDKLKINTLSYNLLECNLKIKELEKELESFKK